MNEVSINLIKKCLFPLSSSEVSHLELTTRSFISQFTTGCGCVDLCKGIKKSFILRKTVAGASDSGWSHSQVSTLTSLYCFKPHVYFYV